MEGTPLHAEGRRTARRWVAHARHDEAAPHRAVLWDRHLGYHVMSANGLIRLDGSEGEGGGQILRSALSLAMITGKAFQIDKIRENRDKPGLRPQHLAAVEAAAKISGATVIGAAVGSRSLTFRPGPVIAEDFAFEIGTAGSAALVLQTLALPLAMAADRPVRVSITGGTFNTHAPSHPFLDACWRKHMAAIGLTIAVAMPRAGFYPKGGGRVEAWIEPGRPRPVIVADRGTLLRVRGEAGVTHLPGGDVAHRMRATALNRLASRDIAAEIATVEWPGVSPGAAISLTAEYACGSVATFVGLGERGKPAESVAQDAVAELLAHHDASGAVDPHSADQILLPLALADGASRFHVSAVTEHLRTNARTIRSFLDCEIRIEEDEYGGGRVDVRGSGHSRASS